MSLIRGFGKGEVDMARLNNAIITTIPKEEETKNLKKFKLISLINCNFKIFSKDINNRLVMICDRLLSHNQTNFIKGRFIFEGVMSAHEIIHNVASWGEKGVVIKLDYEKTYDKVN
jgi:hypothetical protein